MKDHIVEKEVDIKREDKNNIIEEKPVLQTQVFFLIFSVFFFREKFIRPIVSWNTCSILSFKEREVNGVDNNLPGNRNKRSTNVK